MNDDIKKDDIQENEIEEDNIQQTFLNAFENQAIEEEEEEIYDSHHIEIIGPTVALILFALSFWDKMWFASYFGLIFGGVGIFGCKKKSGYVSRGIVLLNVISVALCFFISGLWLILLLLSKM